MGKLRGNAFSRRTAFFALFSWVLMSACSASASGNADASSAVSDVSDLSVSVGDSSVVLKWVDPADENFSAVEISCDSVSVPSVSVSREIQSAVISNLADRTRYAFTVKAYLA